MTRPFCYIPPPLICQHGRQSTICAVCAPAAEAALLASSPSAPDTRSGDAQASAVASTETVRDASPAAGGGDGDGYGQHLLDELRAENERLTAELDQAREELVMLAKLASPTPQFYNPMQARFAALLRDEILASPARLDGDATGRGA